jgi:hypothetical protein
MKKMRREKFRQSSAGSIGGRDGREKNENEKNEKKGKVKLLRVPKNNPVLWQGICQ